MRLKWKRNMYCPTGKSEEKNLYVNVNAGNQPVSSYQDVTIWTDKKV